jgi:hypothetical protein
MRLWRLFPSRLEAARSSQRRSADVRSRWPDWFPRLRLGRWWSITLLCWLCLNLWSNAQDRRGFLLRSPGKPGSLGQGTVPARSLPGGASPRSVRPLTGGDRPLPLPTLGLVVPPAPANPIDVAAPPAARVANSPISDTPSGKRSLLEAALEGPPATNPASIVLATEAEKNQKIAEGWDKPWACLFLTGRQHGYMEPCGCTGLENQKGGLNRRDTLLQAVADRGWEVVPIDVGDQVRRFGRQSELKFSKTAEAFKLMNYRAVMLGGEELKLSSSELLLNLTDSDGSFRSPFVAANLEILLPEAPEKFKVIEVGGRKIGITGVLGEEFSKEIPAGDIALTPAATALPQVARDLREADCDFLILLAHTSLEESQKLAQQVPIFDLVVTAGGFGEPTYKPEPIPGTKAVMLQVGVKGMYAGLVGLYDNPAEPLKYQRLALSSQFPDSPRMMELFERYQKELEQASLAGLGLRPLSHPSTREFVGSEKCGECHTTAMEVWKNTPHAHATESIIHPPGRGNVPRHFDPECISCHVTGWNPQGFYPYTSGYLSLEASPHLLGSGCENCHGPGSQHTAAEEGSIEADEALLKKLREEMRLPLAAAQDRCLECHDIDNSPAFHEDGAFEAFWKRIEHYGKD